MIRPLPMLAVAVLVAACATDEEGTVTDAATPEEGEVVSVTLTEHEIELSGEAVAGQVVFDLTNEGDQVHGFVVEGTDIEETLIGDLQPGVTDRVTIELDAGSYTVWCPVGDHRDRGMEADLEVAEASGS